MLGAILHNLFDFIAQTLSNHHLGKVTGNVHTQLGRANIGADLFHCVWGLWWTWERWWGLRFFFYKMLLQSCQNEKGNIVKQHFNTKVYETLLTRFFASIVPFPRSLLVLAKSNHYALEWLQLIDGVTAAQANGDWGVVGESVDVRILLLWNVQSYLE